MTKISLPEPRWERPTERWVHRPSREGATAYGAHFFKHWDTCERYWFMKYRAPHPDGTGHGLATVATPQPLLFGRYMHEFLAAYYLSGASDGKYDLEAAIRTVQPMIVGCQEYEDAQQRDQDIALLLKLAYDYDDYWQDDWPDLKVFIDDEGPVIERQYTVELPNGWSFTCRVDAVVEFRGFLYVMEHKTTAAQRLGALRRDMQIDSQATGECYVINRHPAFKDHPVQGILLNCLVKNRGTQSKMPAFLRDPISRTEVQLLQFELDVMNKAGVMMQKNDQYDLLVENGADPWDASRPVFQLTGSSNGLCQRFNRPCEYLGLCTALGAERVLANQFRPAILPQPPEDNPDAA